MMKWSLCSFISHRFSCEIDIISTFNVSRLPPGELVTILANNTFGKHIE